MSLHLNLSTGKFLNSSTLFKLSDALLLDVSSGEIVMSNLLVPRAGVDLFKLASLDLNFSQYKALTDRVSGTNLVTFSRASSGTYVDSDGLIKTSPVNKLLYSNDFSNAAWIKSDVTSTSTNITAPDGTATATTFTFTQNEGYIYQNTSSVIGQPYVTSIWIKGNANATIGLRRPGMSNSTIGDGSVAVNVTTEWQKFTAVTTSADTTDGRLLIDLRSSQGASVPSGFGVSLWHAQTEEGTTATDYIPTGATISGAPRFDHDPLNGESLGLLIEEERTNLLTNSSGDVNSSYWVRSSMPSVSTVDGPAGANTAIQYLSAGGTIIAKIQTVGTNSPATVIGTQYVLSCYVKGVNYDVVTFGGNAGPFGSNTRCNFNISDGTLLIKPTAAESARAIPAGNGWYRLEVVTIAATAVGTIQLFLDLGTGSTEPHTTTEGFQVYGFQVEEGTFVSSYIPTTNAQATRAEDNVLISSTNFSSWYNQSSGTFVTTTSSVTNLQSSINRGIFIVNETGVSGSIFRHYELYRGNGADDFNLASRFNSAAAFSPVNTGDPTYSNDTIAYGYSSSDISKVFYDGSLISSSPSVLDWSTYTANQLNIGGLSRLNGHISRLAYFPTLKTDQELIKITDGTLDPAIITYGITSPGGVFNLRSFGTVDYAVDWDSTGGYETSTFNTLPYTYTAGNYDLVVYSDDVYRPYFNNVAADASQITSVVIGSGANLGTNLANAWQGATNMTSFVCAFDVTSGVTSFTAAWRSCNSLTSFPLINTSSGTNFSIAWQGCSSLTSFPLINTSSGTNFSGAWRGCTSLNSFPLINTSSCTIFSIAWRSCSNLTSFPLIDTSSGTTFINAWRDCSSLTSFPANMFDTTGTLVAGAFSSTWNNCALTAQSIEHILVSLDTNGATGVTLGINGGTNAAKTTWSAAAVTAYDNLITKGWTIFFNA